VSGSITDIIKGILGLGPPSVIPTRGPSDMPRPGARVPLDSVIDAPVTVHSYPPGMVAEPRPAKQLPTPEQMNRELIGKSEVPGDVEAILQGMTKANRK